MATLTVTGTFTYAHNQFRDEEAPVFLYLYLDRTFAPLHQAHIAVNPHEQRSPQPFTLTGHVSEAYLPGHATVAGQVAQLPADAKLCAQAYVTARNEFGIHGREDHGATTFDLRHVHREWDAAQRTGGAAAIQAPLAIHTTQNKVTGVLALRIERMSITAEAHGVRPVSIGFAAPQPYMNVEENADRLSDAIREYMETFAEERGRFSDTVAGSENIVCPLDPSEATVLNSELPIPLVGYALGETMRVDAGWWVQQAEIMADRQGYSLSEYAARYPDLPLETQAAEALALVSQYPQQLTYIADKVGGKGNEMFGDALVVDYDDCDGLGLALELQRRQFVECDLAQASAVGEAGVRAMFAHMQHIASQYVSALCIAGVSTSHVENVHERGAAGLRVDNAHFAIKYLPHPLFAQYVRNYQASHPLGHPQLVAACIRPRPAGAGGGSGAGEPFAIGAHDQSLRPVDPDQLPVLMGEGTGIMYPVQARDPLLEERARLYSHMAMGPIKKPQIPPPGASDFYRVSLIVFTNAFVDTHRIGTFRFCTPNAALEREGKYSRGALFTDIMAKRPDLMLVPFGFSQRDSPVTPSISVPLPPHLARVEGHSDGGSSGTGRGTATRINPRFVPEFTHGQLQMIRSTIKTRVPPRHFQACPKPVLEYDSRHPVLDRLCEVAGSPQAERTQSVEQRRTSNRARTLHVYVQPEVADSTTWQAYMEKHLRANAGHLIKSMNYVREVHSDTVARWRLSFRV